MQRLKNGSRYMALAGGIIVQIFVGIIYIWSIFQEPVIEYFNWTHSGAALTFSVMLPMNVLGVTAGGILNDRKGARFVLHTGGILMTAGLLLSSLIPKGQPWLLYIFYAGMGGFGGGLAYNATVSCAQKWWLDRKGLAGGIIVCAYGMSTVVFTPVVNMLLGENGVGVKNTFRILAAVFAVIVLTVGWFVVNPDEEYMDNCVKDSKEWIGKKQYKPGDVLRSGKYYMVLICLLCLTPAYLMLNPMIKSLGELRGLSEEIAVISVMITGLASALGRLTAAWLSDKIGCKRVLLMLYTITFVSILLLWNIHGNMFIVLIALITYAYGGCAGVTPVLATDFFGTKYMSSNFGLVMISVMISGIAYPTLGTAVSPAGIPAAQVFLIPAVLCVAGFVTLHFLYGKD
ncbi:MFS transporter [[Clostridium] hylemonae]|uniref:Transporter, major facilitator family protein n=1 Tax=[Clostridium] hylemonae DSM 15053 TaxID=553973 RepID=C0BXQ4_9FIRM|nr:MFS transporter [[Clostridium] hylemonae]EEG75361.1 transporter, major facilitator family protein [[Clostridium] hylemonae DSM 15053]QEK17073.1 putative MFS-type transporter YhjX [[Clostridium] hylemonae DSM 15053]